MNEPNRIAELRKAKGWSQEKLAKAAGTTNQQIGFLEKGKRRLTVEWIQRLASALGCEQSEILRGSKRKIIGSEGADEEKDMRPDAAIIGEAGPNGSLILTIPANSPIRNIALKLLRLAAAASREERQAVLLRLEHPALYQPANKAEPDYSGFADGIRLGLQRTGISPDSPEGARLIADALELRAAGIEPVEQVKQAATRSKLKHSGAAGLVSERRSAKA